MKWALLLLFGGAGLAALVGGLAWGWHRLPLLQSGIRTMGVVVGQSERRSTASRGSGRRTGSEEVVVYNPVVEFTGASGELHRFTGATGGEGRPLIETGTGVSVIYDPSDPAHAAIASFSQFWLGPLMMAGGGLIFLMMGVGGYLLIAGQDQRMEELAAMMQHEPLVLTPGAPTLQGTIVGAEERPPGSGHYVFVCRGTRPGASADEAFVSEYLPFNPGLRYLGRKVTIHLDPGNPAHYFVNLDALLPEIMEDGQR